MDLKQLIEKALKADGYDGLWWNGGGEETCGCKLGDLMWCDEPSMDCEAGYLMTGGENVGPGPRETEPAMTEQERTCGGCQVWQDEWDLLCRKTCFVFDWNMDFNCLDDKNRSWRSALSNACPAFKGKEK